MTGITSDISIASNGLLLLGHDPIASFTEPTAGATIAANLYETSYLSLITAHRWRFATKKAKLARLSAKPLNGFNYQFQIPSDCLYVIRVSTVRYEIYESTIHCNDEALEMDFLYRVTEDRLPPYFAKMLEFFLAAQFAVPLTGDMNKGKYFQAMYLNELKRAKFADSTQRPNVGFQDSPYTATRY